MLTRKRVYGRNTAMGLKGLRNIKTHMTLARAGQLVSVARDLRSLNVKENAPHSNNWNNDWNLERHVFKKKKPASATIIGRFQYRLDFARKIRLHQIEAIQDLLGELRQAMDEGLLISQHEFERLKTRLAELQIE